MNNNTLLVFTDGRGDLLQETLYSFNAHVAHQFRWAILIDDSGDPAYAALLEKRYAHFSRIVHHPVRRGFGGAIRSGWKTLPKETEFVFHLEDDFVFQQSVTISDMMTALELDFTLAQMALLRQPWNDRELAAGGIVQLDPTAYVEHIDANKQKYLRHNKHWTTNPSLYRYAITRFGWPDELESEGKFGIRLREKGYHFGYWGGRDEAPKVRHIGTLRVGNGY